MPCFPPSLERVSAPTIEPLTLAEAKLFLRIDGCDEDLLIVSLMGAARDAAEVYLRRSLMAQGWKLSFHGGIDACVELPRGPVQAITHVRLIAADGSYADLSPSQYRLDAAKGLLVIDTGAVATVIEILYTAGYASAEAVPPAIRSGLLSHIAALYASRESGVLPPAAIAAYAPFREVRL